ncbi:hypothetical protein D3C71_1377050 [compost metagenome]
MHCPRRSWVGVEVECSLVVFLVEQVLQVQVEANVVVDLVKGQQVDNGVLVHVVSHCLGLAIAVIDVLHPNPQTKAFSQSVLEFVGVEQAEAVPWNVRQPGARGQAVVLGHFSVNVGITTDHTPLRCQVSGNVDIQATATYFASGKVVVGVRRVACQHIFLDDVVDRRVNAQLTVRRFPFHTQLIRLAFLRVEARTLQAGAAVGLK